MKQSEAKRIANKLFYLHDARGGIGLTDNVDRYKIMYRHSPGITKGNHKVLSEYSSKALAEEKLTYIQQGFLRSISEFIEP